MLIKISSLNGVKVTPSIKMSTGQTSAPTTGTAPISTRYNMKHA